MTVTKQCNTCGEVKPLTTDYFNLLSGGTWRGSCKTCRNLVSKKHHASNPEMTAARREKYKKTLLNAEGTYQPVDIAILRRQQNDECHYCGKKLNGKGEKDHKIPISKGGTNWIFNIALTCVTCNRDKGSKTEENFISWRKSLELKVR